MGHTVLRALPRPSQVRALPVCHTVHGGAWSAWWAVRPALAAWRNAWKAFARDVARPASTLRPYLCQEFVAQRWEAFEELDLKKRLGRRACRRRRAVVALRECWPAWHGTLIPAVRSFHTAACAALRGSTPAGCAGVLPQRTYDAERREEQPLHQPVRAPEDKHAKHRRLRDDLITHTCTVARDPFVSRPRDCAAASVLLQC